VCETHKTVLLIIFCGLKSLLYTDVMRVLYATEVTGCVLLASGASAHPVNSAASCIAQTARNVINTLEGCISDYVSIIFSAL